MKAAESVFYNSAGLCEELRAALSVSCRIRRSALRHVSVTDLSTLSTIIFVVIIGPVTSVCSDGSATVGLSHLDHLD